MGELSDVEIRKLSDQLDVEGYAVLRDVVSKVKLEQLRVDLMRCYDQFVESGQVFKGGGTLTGHLNCFPGEGSKFIYDEICEYGIVDLVRARDADAAQRPRATLNFNLPGSVAQHYHADGLYTEKFLICNVAVVDTDLRNGAIDVLPGTNREFYKFWRYALERKYRLTTRLTLDQGDVLLRLSTMWHRGMPNLSNTPRPMAAITFGERSAPEGDPYKEHDGEVVFYPNWYSTSRLGQLRERTFKVAPITYSSYRFLTSLHGNKGYSSF